MTDHVNQFTNCRLIRNGRLNLDIDLWVQNGKVIDPQKLFFAKQKKADRVIDCQGSLIAPGFIDIQINGRLSIIYFLTFYITITKTGSSLSKVDLVTIFRTKTYRFNIHCSKFAPDYQLPV
jgi:hypothetical protein